MIIFRKILKVLIVGISVLLPLYLIYIFVIPPKILTVDCRPDHCSKYIIPFTSVSEPNSGSYAITDPKTKQKFFLLQKSTTDLGIVLPKSYNNKYSRVEVFLKYKFADPGYKKVGITTPINPVFDALGKRQKINKFDKGLYSFIQIIEQKDFYYKDQDLIFTIAAPVIPEQDMFLKIAEINFTFYR